jgi:transcriptional regulator with XRE-family HTH domain
MNYDPLELFGKRVVELRKAKGWSQEKLALESGLARSYVGGIERGLAETLGVAPTDMLAFETMPKKAARHK